MELSEKKRLAVIYAVILDFIVMTEPANRAKSMEMDFCIAVAEWWLNLFPFTVYSDVLLGWVSV